LARPGKKDQIMAAAEKLFTSRRFHEITLDDVVHEAGVGKGTIYRYFKDKDDLFFQVAASGFDELCALLNSEIDKTASFDRQLLAACENVSAFFSRRRQLFRMMQAEDARMRWCRKDTRDQWDAKRRKLAEALSSVLRRGVESGRLRDDVPPEILAAFLLGMLRTRNRELEEAPESARSYEVLLDLFTRGAQAAHAQTPIAP